MGRRLGYNDRKQALLYENKSDIQNHTVKLYGYTEGLKSYFKRITIDNQDGSSYVDHVIKLTKHGFKNLCKPSKLMLMNTDAYEQYMRSKVPLNK